MNFSIIQNCPPSLQSLLSASLSFSPSSFLSFNLLSSRIPEPGNQISLVLSFQNQRSSLFSRSPGSFVFVSYLSGRKWVSEDIAEAVLEQDCIGAIDGVHVEASIPPPDQVPYIGRKGMPTQNVMAACDFDMQFTFACAGWEDTAHDIRVFLSVLRNPNLNFSKPPNGKYYLVDAGYPQMRGYLGPYKGERYHLLDFRRGGEPTGHKEVFNHMHSSLRSIIERTFGVWKKKWAILRDMPN